MNKKGTETGTATVKGIGIWGKCLPCMCKVPCSPREIDTCPIDRLSAHLRNPEAQMRQSRPLYLLTDKVWDFRICVHASLKLSLQNEGGLQPNSYRDGD